MNRANIKKKSFKFKLFSIFCFDTAHNNLKTIDVLSIFNPGTRLTGRLCYDQKKVFMVGYFPQAKCIVSLFTSSENKRWNCFGDQRN